MESCDQNRSRERANLQKPTIPANEEASRTVGIIHPSKTATQRSGTSYKSNTDPLLEMLAFAYEATLAY